MAIITKRRKAFTVIYQRVDENGVSKAIYETYYDYHSALARKNEVENTNNFDEMNIDLNTTIKDFLVQYVAKIGIHQWSNSRYESNNGLINNYISKVIGKKKIKDVTPDFGQKVINKLQKTPALGKRNQQKTEYIPTGMIRSCYVLLKSSFDYLVFQKLIESNPFYDCIVPIKQDKKSKNEWNIGYVEHLFNKIYDIRLFIFMHIMFSTGLDIREIGGLSWDDVFIDDDLIANDQCYLYSDKLLDRLNKNTIQQLDPKRIIKQFACVGFNQTNTSLTLLYKEVPKKSVHIHKEVAILLKSWKEKQDDFMINENPYNLLITLVNGKPCDDRNMSKLYHSACEEAHLKNLTITKFKNFSQRKRVEDSMTNADFYYSNIDKPLQLPKQPVSTTHVFQLNRKKISEKIKIKTPQPENEEMNILLQQLKDNPELKMKLIDKLKAEL